MPTIFPSTILNRAESDEVPSFTSPQYVIVGTIFGLTIKTCLIGFVCTCLRLFARESRYFWKVACIISCFNMAGIIFTCLFAANMFSTRVYCESVSFWLNFASHFFFINFDFFMLYKARVTSGGDIVVACFTVLISINRVIWAIWDLVWSYGLWDESLHQCVYSQNELTGIGYNSADMICDIFCTIVAIAFNLKNFNSQFQRFAMILVQENIIRSILVVAINSAMLYATQNVTDPYLLTLYFAIQNWIYVFSLNAELLWIDVRKATHHNDVKRSMIPSPDRASSNMNQSVSRINQALSVVTTTDRLSAIKLDNQ